MATFNHIADCGVIGEQELTVSYEANGGRAVIQGISLGNRPVKVSDTYLIKEVYPELFAIEDSKKAESVEMRRAA